MNNKKLAPRPFTLNLPGNADTNDAERYTLTIDANDVDRYDWGFTNCDPKRPLADTDICETRFYKRDEKSLTGECIVGTVRYSANEFGLGMQQFIGDALYEARHPWLDYADLYENIVIIPKQSHAFLLKHKCNTNYITLTYDLQIPNPNVIAFKPLDSMDFHHFQQVKVWKG